MIELNHTIVPARDRHVAAQFFARIFGLAYGGEPQGYFAPVRVSTSLTLDFETSEQFEPHHYAFKVSEVEFDAIFGRIQSERIPYGSGPFSLQDGKLNHRGGGRGVYFCDPDGHILELLTVG
jgi:catechol 2,3-dioxygenase-like lactoylglutathione lyase family enzyme